MKTAGQILHEQGIELKITALGNHRAICPKCVDSRKKKKAKCLSVKITDQGVQWHCFITNCNFSGGEYFEQSSLRKSDKFSQNQKDRCGDSDAFGRIQRQNWHKWKRSASSTL